MRDKWNGYKIYSTKRNGKDCYIKFRIEKFREVIFNSAEHKIPLNVYRILKTRRVLRAQGIYI